MTGIVNGMIPEKNKVKSPSYAEYLEKKLFKEN